MSKIYVPSFRAATVDAAGVVAEDIDAAFAEAMTVLNGGLDAKNLAPGLKLSVLDATAASGVSATLVSEAFAEKSHTVELKSLSDYSLVGAGGALLGRVANSYDTTLYDNWEIVNASAILRQSTVGLAAAQNVDIYYYDPILVASLFVGRIVINAATTADYFAGYKIQAKIKIPTTFGYLYSVGPNINGTLIVSVVLKANHIS